MAPRELNGVVSEKLIVQYVFLRTLNPDRLLKIDGLGLFSGTTNVRIADMSIVPIHIAAHTCETAYAIGEKVSLNLICT